MRLTTMDFVGFRFGDGTTKLGDSPGKTVVIEGPNGSGKTRFCELLFRCLQLANGGAGPASFADPELGRAKATLDFELEEREAIEVGGARSCSLECFFGQRPMVDARLDRDPAVALMGSWQGRGQLVGRIDTVVGAASLGRPLLLDLALGEGGDKAQALAAALADLGLAVDGVARAGELLVPAIRADQRRPLSELSSGERAAIDLLAYVAASESRFVILDCVDDQLDDELAAKVMTSASALFAGWQLFVTTRKRQLHVGGASRVTFTKSAGGSHV